jgi:hypothetical protein
MVAACLTGHKDPTAALHALDELARSDQRLGVLAGAVRCNVDAIHRGRRKPIAELRAALHTDAADIFTTMQFPRPEQPASRDNIEVWVDIEQPVPLPPTVKLPPREPFNSTKIAQVNAAHAEAVRVRVAVTLTVIVLLIALIVALAAG